MGVRGTIIAGALVIAALCGAESIGAFTEHKRAYDLGFKEGSIAIAKAEGPVFGTAAHMMDRIVADLTKVTSQRDECLAGQPIKDGSDTYYPTAKYAVRGVK